MKRKLTLIFLALFISIGFWQLLETPIYAQNKPLTIEQVINSLTVSDDKKKESAITAKKVRQVGVSFPFTRETEDVLRSYGATNELIEAIRQNSPPIPKLITQALNIVTSPPECEVYVDDVRRGTTDAAGKAMFSDVAVGEHRVTVRKSRYREATFPLSLSSEKEGQINADLELAVGFLTVNTNVPNAGIDISGIGHFDNSISKVECATGTYTITIASPLYVTSRREISVTAGQDAQLSVILEVDSAARNRLISEAQKAYSSQQYDRAISLAKTLLSANAKDSQTLAILAESYFMKNEFYSFTESARQAIDAGGSLEFNLQHHDFMMVNNCITCLGERLHPVKLTLTAASVSFDPQVQEQASCSYRKFSHPIDKLSTAQVDQTNGGFFKKGAGTYLKIVLQDPTNPKKTYTLNFADPASSLAQDTEGKIFMKSRVEADQALNAIAALLNRAKASITPPPPPPIPKKS